MYQPPPHSGTRAPDTLLFHRQQNGPNSPARSVRPRSGLNACGLIWIAWTRRSDCSIPPWRRNHQAWVKRTGRSRSRSGELTRTTLSILRQAIDPFLFARSQRRLPPSAHLNMSTITAANVVVANVRAAPARPHEGLMSEKRGKEPMVYRVDKS